MNESTSHSDFAIFEKDGDYLGSGFKMGEYICSCDLCVDALESEESCSDNSAIFFEEKLDDAERNR